MQRFIEFQTKNILRFQKVISQKEKGHIDFIVE